MFTGIIEEKGTVKQLKRSGVSFLLTIEADKIFSDLKLGDSVAVNGVCLTADEISGKTFTAYVMVETVSRTSLGNLKSGKSVNLERAMLAGGRFGGHIVSGHVDGTGIIKSMKHEEDAVRIRIATSPDILRYVIEKGSVTLDGISLTVTDVTETELEVSIIPHTAKNTTLSDKKAGDIVNIENDIIGKYVDKLMNFSHSSPQLKSGITLDFLRENGF